MIHYHGTPVGGKREDAARFLQGRHALISFANPDDLAVAADVCQSFVLDNGAFSFWRKGKPVNWMEYITWVEEWSSHPGFDWALIPDMIDGTESQNDDLIKIWCDEELRQEGVPVWHFHESLERLDNLALEWPRVALGSSGDYPTPGAKVWWGRMNEIMDVLCFGTGKPRCKIHGLRMMNPSIFTKIPFSSVDSTNASMNAGSLKRFGTYLPPTRSQRAEVIANRIEQYNSPPVWVPNSQQDIF